MYHTGEAPEALVKTVLALPGNPEVLVCNERRALTDTIADGSKLQVVILWRVVHYIYLRFSSHLDAPQHARQEDACLALLAEVFSVEQVPLEEEHPYYRSSDIDVFELSRAAPVPQVDAPRQ